MSGKTDSRVVDALHEGQNLERVLEALGCDTSKDNGSPFESPSGYIHCPMPDHPDTNPSVTVRVGNGQVFCHSRCDIILPADLVVAHGHATDRAGAMKWIEQKLGLEPVKLRPQTIVDDPSLTVAQYLAMKGLPASTVELFGLQDVRVWQAGAERGTKNCAYETGWYPAVFMPMREGRRPRLRTDAPGVKIKWAPKVRFADGRMVDFTNDDADPTAFKWPLDVIGLPQLRVTNPDAPRVLVVVEGESDVHAMHAMGLPCVVGVPGSKMCRRVAASLLEACIFANGGDTDLSQLTVIVWSEPGSAGAQFPRDVAAAIVERAMESGQRPPTFATLPFSAVPTSPKDPAALLLDRPVEIARQQLEAAIMAAIPTPGAAAPTMDPTRAPAAPGIQPALDVLQLDGPHTPPPASGAMEGPAAAVETNPVVAPAKPALKLLPGAIAATAEEIAGAGIIRAGGEWKAFDELELPPLRERAPESVSGVAATFHRTDEGWSVEATGKDGDTQLRAICTPFVVEAVERCSGEILIRVAAPFGGAWNRDRIAMSQTADAGRACAALATLGVSVAQRQRAMVADLLGALTTTLEAKHGAVHVPACTGWSGMPGSSLFGGIEIEPVNDFGSRMYQANLRRRELQPDTRAAAMEWALKGALPLLKIGDPSKATAADAAALLAIGAAAAAVLVGPLSECGVSVAPVVWIAGLGGGGKSVTQKLAASIFAPSLPDNDGQSAFFANANISQAALSARVDSCRDLPLILDDVTQLPPLPGSTSRGDAARIEAAAALGMMVFNRKPIERATREGGIRQTRAFRSSAIFSAEVNMSSETSKAVVTAGHRRRISTIEARPMHDRGLDHHYAEMVNHLSATVGGAPGDLLVAHARDLTQARRIRGMFDSVHSRIAAMPEAAEVTLTQRQSLAITVLGYAVLFDAITPGTFDQLVADACVALRAYMAAGAGAGGATRDSDLSGVAAALRSVDDLRAAQPARFDNQVKDEMGYILPQPTMGYLGKELRARYDGTRRIAMLRSGQETLQARYGVTSQVIEQALSEGACERRQIRMSDGTRAYAIVWLLPPSVEDDEDTDPSLPPGHDPDPHGLARPVANPQRVHVPGQLVDPEPEQITEVSIGRTDGPWRTAAWLAEHRTHEDLERWIFSGLEYPINDEEGHGMDARFSYGNGLYMVGDGPACRENVSILKTIRMEARQELEALAMQYRHAAEANPDYVIVVADFPADDDPRWSAIDNLGPETARAQWDVMAECLYARNQIVREAGLDAARAHDEAYVKAYRVGLMCRYRHPEWFIQGRNKP